MERAELTECRANDLAAARVLSGADLEAEPGDRDEADHGGDDGR